MPWNSEMVEEKKQNNFLLQWSSEHFFLNLLVQPYIKDSSFFLGTLKIPKVYSAKVYPCQLPKCVPAKCLKQKCIPATSPKLVNCKSLFPQKNWFFVILLATFGSYCILIMIEEKRQIFIANLFNILAFRFSCSIL